MTGLKATSSQPSLPFDQQVERNGSDAGAEDPLAEPLEVRIVRSRRRKKTVGAQLIEGVVEVTVPMWMSTAEAERFANQMRGRFERKRVRSDVDLVAQARSLARTYDFPVPASVRWVSNQNSRWGSCTPVDGSIRLSDRLKDVPRWVVDYVLVHEIAHLRYPDHSPAFWNAVNRYPKTERARGFLMGIGFTDDEGGNGNGGRVPDGEGQG